MFPERHGPEMLSSAVKPLSFFDIGLLSGTQTRHEQKAPQPKTGPRGLMVRDPYATQILDGKKSWEIRGRATQIRGQIVIIKSGSGNAFGTVNLVRVLGPLELEDLICAPELPLAERREFQEDGLPYKKTYAYVLSKPKWFESPIKYDHPSGAVTWVRLPGLDLSSVNYAEITRERVET